MADNTKNLKIKLLVDTTEGAKLGASLEDAAKKAQTLSRSLEFGDGGLSNRVKKLQSFKQELISTQLISAKVAQESINKLNDAEIRAQKVIEEKARGHNLMAQNIIRARQKTLDILTEEGRRVELLQEKYKSLARSVANATLGTGSEILSAAQDTRATSRNTSSLSSALGMRQQEKNEVEKLLKAEQELLITKQRALTLGVSASAISANAIAQQRTAAIEIKRDIGTALGMRQQETIAIRNATNALNQQAAAQQRIVDKQRAGSFSSFGASSAARQEARPDAVVANRSLYAMGLSNVKRQETKEIQNNTQALKDNNSAASLLERTKSSLTSRVIEAVTVYKLYNATLHAVRNAMRAIPQIGIEMQSTFASLTSTVGTEAGAVFFMEKLNQEAKRTGIEITTLRETFRTFQASTSLAGESLESTWNMFKNINTVATALHQTADRTNLTFLALAQIFNKSKVQAEELVKQLGNLLPGAFASFQKANEDMFKTIPDLVKAMQNGTVRAQDTVEKFTNFMADRFAGAFVIAAQGLNAEFGRMTTSITLLGESIFKSIEQPLTQSVRTMTQFINYLNEAATSGNTLTVIVNGLGHAFNGFLSLGIIGLLSKLTTSLMASRLAALGFAGALTVVVDKTKLLLGRFGIPALIVGFGTLISVLKETDTEARKVSDRLRDTYDEIIAKRRELQQQATREKALASGNIEIAVENDPGVTAALKNLNDAKKQLEIAQKSGISLGTFLSPSVEEIAEARQRNREAINAVKFFQEELNRSRELAIFAAKEAAQQFQQDLIPTIDGVDTTVEFLRNQGQYLEAARIEVNAKYSAVADSIIQGIEKVTLALKAGKIQDVEGANAFLENAMLQLGMVNANMQAAIEKDVASRLKTTTPKQKDNNSIYDDIKRQYDLMAISAESAFNKLEDLYDDNLINIDAYFKEKERLRIDDLNKETEALRRIQAEASRRGDSNKVSSTEFDIQKNFAQAGIEQERRDRARIVALREFSDLQKQTQADYLEFQGNATTSEALRAEIDFRDRINKAIIEGDRNLQNQLTTLKSHRINLAELDELSRRRNINTERLNQLEIRYQRDVELGIMSQGNAVTEINKLRSEGLDLLQSEIDRTRQILEANRDDLTVQERLNALLIERSNLGNTPNINRILDQTQGTTGFFGQFQQDKGNIDQEYNQAKNVSDLEINEAVLAQNWEQYEVLLQGRLALDEKYSSATAHVYTGLYGGMFKLGADTFQGITDAAASMYGAQSKEARKAFMITKGIRMAEAAMATAQAVIVALGAGPYIGIALAAVTAALGAAQIAQIAAQQPPAAHGGLTNVPKEQTYLLDKGERVLSPNQNKDFTTFINNATMKSEKPVNNIRIINSIDPSVMKDFIGSTEGEEIIMNVVKRNQAEVY